MTDRRIHRLVYAALMAALVCAGTMVIQIPSPTNGYVNAGDSFVLLSGWLLGPWLGGAAAGIGSMLTDLLLGYAHYAPGTLLIKGLDAAVAGLLFRALGGRLGGQILSSVTGELVMTAGYFAYTALLLGRGIGAAASVPGNLIQGAVATVLAILLFQAARHTVLKKNEL